MTNVGGQNSAGVIFEYNHITNTYTIKYDFIAGIDGSRPIGSLLQAADGMFYGSTAEGGVDNAGVIFQYNPVSNIYTTKFIFFYTNSLGAYPQGELIQANDGMLYGMTRDGGLNGKGVLFQYNPVSETYSKKLDFDGIGSGGSPYGALLQAADGYLYGTTRYGGINDLGTLFQYDPVNSLYTKKMDFNGFINGSNPSGSLVKGADGLLYGTAERGGVNEKGVIFQYNFNSNTYVKKQDLAFSVNGSYPFGALTNYSNGKLYGVTSLGGINGKGVLYQFDPLLHIYTKIIDFDSLNTGSFPIGTLVLATDNKLYGVTKTGGVYGHGTLFQFDPLSNMITKKFDFNALTDGKYPCGNLMQASTGELYGMTTSGGNNFNNGVIFKYNISTNVFTKETDFLLINGTKQEGSLTEFTDGKLYGLASYGGVGFKGTIFMYDPLTSTCIKKLDFSGSNGSHPKSCLTLTNGKLFGVAPTGGINDMGVLFEYDVTNNAIIKKLDFSNVTNEAPFGPLYKASNGKLYGTTDVGSSLCGTVFEYDPTTNNYLKKIDFNYTNGCNPYLSNVIEVSAALNNISENNMPFGDFTLYPNPNNGSFTINLQNKSQISITNTLGEIILNQSFNTGKQVLSLQNQSNGVYFATVIDSQNQLFTQKIILNK